MAFRPRHHARQRLSVTSPSQDTLDARASDADQIPDGETRILGPFPTAGFAALVGSIISDRVLTVTVSLGPSGDLDGEGDPVGPWPIQFTPFDTSGDDDDGDGDELDYYVARHSYVLIEIENDSGGATTAYRADLALTTAQAAVAS